MSKDFIVKCNVCGEEISVAKDYYEYCNKYGVKISCNSCSSMPIKYKSKRIVDCTKKQLLQEIDELRKFSAKIWKDRNTFASQNVKLKEELKCYTKI